MNTAQWRNKQNYGRNKVRATRGQRLSNPISFKLRFTHAPAATGSNRQPNWPTANKVTKNRQIVKNCKQKTADKIVKFWGKPAGGALARRRLKMHSHDAIWPRLALSTSSQSDYPSNHPSIHLSDNKFLACQSVTSPRAARTLHSPHYWQIANTLQLNRKRNQNTNYAESIASNLFWDLKSV